MDTTSITGQVALRLGIYLEQQPETLKQAGWPVGPFRWVLKREDKSEIDFEASYAEVCTSSATYTS